MERYTQVPSTADALVTLATQMIAVVVTYPEFGVDLLTIKKVNAAAAITDVAGKQVTNDEKSALYISARNVYFAARDLLNAAKDSLSDASGLLKSHIQDVLAEVTAGMTAQEFATLEADCGIALTVPLVYLAPVVPILVVAKYVNATAGMFNWSPSDADDDGHAAADAYLVEKSADGTAYTFERVVTVTEVYVTVGTSTHYRVTPVSNGSGNGAPLVVLVSGFTPAP